MGLTELHDCPGNEIKVHMSEISEIITVTFSYPPIDRNQSIHSNEYAEYEMTAVQKLTVSAIHVGMTINLI